MRLRLTPRSMTLDDLDQFRPAINTNSLGIRRISQIWKPTTSVFIRSVKQIKLYRA